MRVVYDASARQSRGPSLNDCLYSGPPLSETISDILMRFRCHKTALMGQIEKAFLMISVAENDRDALPFLWFDDPMHEDPQLIALRFARVAFGLSSSPFLLNATLKHRISKYGSEDPEFAQKLLQSLYVADIISGGDDDDQAYEFYVKTKSRLAEGSFNVSKFVSNSKNLMDRLERNEKLLKQGHQETETPLQRSLKTVIEENESYAKSTTQHQDTLPVTEKVVGVQWDKEDDNLVLDLKQFLHQSTTEEPTKRDVVRITSKIYDPFGFITPLTVRLKLFCQSLSQKRLD